MLESIIDTYKTENKKAFAAFIDLRKAFDTVWSEGLLYKFFKYNFPNQVLKIIHSMYQILPVE
jgi:hypothetical protein